MREKEKMQQMETVAYIALIASVIYIVSMMVLNR